jgi:adenylate cyclase
MWDVIRGDTMTANPSEAPWPALRRASRTVVVADVVESVRLMAQDEDGTIRRWQAFVGEVVTRLLPLHGGRLVKSLGDGLMLEFERVPPAVHCAFAMQQAIESHHLGLPLERRMCLRLGVHRAEVVVDEHDIYGAGVNLAARLATLAGPGETVVSSEVREQLADGLDADVEDLGLRYLKHIEQPIRAFRAHRAGAAARPAAFLPTDTDFRSSVAVVPLRPRQPGAETDVLGEIFADEVIDALSRASELRVTSRLSSARVQHVADDPAVLQAQLGVAYVLTGSFHVIGDRVRMSVELCDTRSSSVAWADTLTATVQGVLEGRDDVIAQVVAATGSAIVARELERVLSEPMQSLQGHSLLLASIALMHRATAREFHHARALLEQLAEHHGRVAQPYAWLAKWHVMRTVQGWSEDPEKDASRALAYVDRALDLSPDNSLALATRGHVQGFMRRDHAAADASLRAACESNASESLAWLYRGTLQAWRGEGAAALKWARRAIALSPLDPLRDHYFSHAGFAALTAGELDQAIEWSAISLRANRIHTPTYRTLIVAHALKGEAEAAAGYARELLRLEPGLTVARYLERYPGGDTPYARRSAEALRSAGVPSGG